MSAFGLGKSAKDQASSKLPTPLSKRPALTTLNDGGSHLDIKRSRFDLNQENHGAQRPNRLRRSKSVTSLTLETHSFRNDIANLKKPLPLSRGGSRVGKAPSVANLADKPSNKHGISAPTTKQGKRPAWDLKGRVEDQEIALKETQKSNATLHSTVEFLKEQVLVLQDATKHEKQVAQSKSNDCLQLSAEIQALTAQISAKDGMICQLESSKSELSASIASMKLQLMMKDEENVHLQKTNVHLTAENTTLQFQLNAAKEQISANLSKIQHLHNINTKREAEVEMLRSELNERDEKIQEAETMRRKLHNEVMELKGNIRVFCRVRPLRGKGSDKTIITFAEDNKQQLILQPTTANTKAKTFVYDKVFNQTTTQADVFSEVSQLVQSSLDGYNVCIFAYGQTGSGKTYTMEGPSKYSPENVGMIERAVRQIFKTITHLQAQGWQYQLNATFLEVYNETIRDLLASGRDSLPHEIKMTDDKMDVYVTNLHVTEITTENQICQLLKTAQKHRAVAATMCNDHSSRSHSVFQLKLNGTNEITSESCQGTLNLVDLAGSERLKESQSEGERLKETKNINKSLSNLSNVIMALSQKTDHVPYRNSKLTHLLMNCLGGNSKTLMFVNISPEEEQLNETLSSLRFATKVNQCQIGTASKKIK